MKAIARLRNAVVPTGLPILLAQLSTTRHTGASVCAIGRTGALAVAPGFYRRRREASRAGELRGEIHERKRSERDICTFRFIRDRPSGSNTALQRSTRIAELSSKIEEGHQTNSLQRGLLHTRSHQFGSNQFTRRNFTPSEDFSLSSTH